MRKPVAVLKTVEDSLPELDRRLIQAYLRTIYRLYEPAFDVYIGLRNPALDAWLNRQGWDTFAFITAWNPGSEILPAGENDRRHRDLFKVLRRHAQEMPLPAVHISPDGGWPPEASWWAPGLTPDTAVSIALKFEQNALVFWEKGGVAELWWVSG